MQINLATTIMGRVNGSGIHRDAQGNPLWDPALLERSLNRTAIVEATRSSVTVLPLPHPSWRNTAWIKRHPFFEEELLPELRSRVRDLLGD